MMNHARYDESARNFNSLMYDYYAADIKERTGITQGECLDVGSSGGYLGLALAKVTDLSFTFLDISTEGLEKAKQHIVEDGLAQRAKTLCADVQSIPMPDGSVQLVISRGSIPFWADPAKGLREIYRVLAPGGQACVICGRGSPAVREAIKEKRGGEEMRKRMGPPRNIPRHDYEQVLKDTGISQISMNRDESGFWIRMWK
ncbi:MAG: class I SAM-dependent methyltransferase [Opitutales bacterium]|jgi:SAM-dependent methyltransferase